uniref:Arginyl-tRNA--protein transferase 1 n=1 Tax=Sinocyclocheilus grahami TaxID=75366 RepID=A0A672PVM9_SINGR
MAAGGSYSIVEYFGGDGGYRCGYCKHENGNFSHGMWSHTMTVQDYQDLIDRGWRRSGKYVYKPLMNKTCCPQYTIRCHALNFHPSKTHKKTLKKVNRFLSKGEMPVERHDEGLEGEPMDSAHEAGVQPPRQDLLKIDHSEVQDISTSPDTDTTNSTAPITPREDAVPAPAEKTPNVTPKSGQSHRIQARQEKRRRKDEERQRRERGERGKKKILVPFPRHTVDRPSTSWVSFSAMLGGGTGQPSVDGLTLLRLPVRLVPVSFEDPDFLASYEQSAALYARYQTTVHGDSPYECGESEAETAPDGPDVGYGSFHQQYWLDGRIVAVGVLDILPSCVSSVYLYYHPEFSSLSLGTYSALREIAFTRQLQQQSPKLAYYYLGFYVHSCPKMRYKRRVPPPPSLHLPPTPSTRCFPKLPVNSTSRPKETSDACALKELGRVLVLHRRTVMPYAAYARKRKGSNDEKEVEQYASLLGQTCAEKILLYRA